MLNLIKMDFNIYRNGFLWMLVYTVFFAGIYSNITFIGTVSMLCVYLIIFTAFATEERDRIHLLHKSLPVSDREVVGTKYLEVLIVWGLSVIAGTVIMIITQRIKSLAGTADSYMFDIEEFIQMIFVMFFLTMLMVSVTIPLIYKFGYSKGRYVGMIVWLAVALGFSSIFFAIDFSKFLISPDFIYITDIIVSAALMIISFFVSVKSYKAR